MIVPIKKRFIDRWLTLAAPAGTGVLREDIAVWLDETMPGRWVCRERKIILNANPSPKSLWPDMHYCVYEVIFTTEVDAIQFKLVWGEQLEE